MRLRCAACGAPASRSGWEFKADPKGRLCVSCYADGAVREPRQDAPSRRRPKVGQVDRELVALLHRCHEDRRCGIVPPLTEPGELSAYQLDGWSCVPAWNAAARRARRRKQANGTQRRIRPTANRPAAAQ